MISLIEAYKRIDRLKKRGYKVPDNLVSSIFIISSRDKMEKTITQLETELSQSRH